MLSTVHDPTVLMKNVSITPALYYSAHCIYIAQNIKKHKNMMLLYLNGHLSAATVFAEDIRGDTFEDFAECSAAEEHCKFDLFTTKMSQWCDIFQGQRRRAITEQNRMSRHVVPLSLKSPSVARQQAGCHSRRLANSVTAMNETSLNSSQPETLGQRKPPPRQAI